MRYKAICLIAALFTLAGLGAAQASMVHIPTTYGLSARSIAMGNTTTALTEDVCLPYFNPAAMAMSDTSKIGITYLYAQPNFQGGLKNGELKDFEDANKILTTGLIFSLNEFLKSNRKITFGMNISLDENGKAFIRFQDLMNENGTYARYGVSSFVINAGVGFEIMQWFYFGGGVLTTLHSGANFYVDVDLAGRTEDEGMNLDADVYFAPVIALFLHFDPVNIGLTYRGENNGEMVPITVEAQNSVGGSALVDLPMNLQFKDSFVPAALSLGIGWNITESVLLAVDGVWYGWGSFDETMTTDDLVRETSDIDMVDTYVPKIGIEYTLVEKLHLRAGYSYEKSPLRKPGSFGNYILDNDKHVGAFGLGYDLELGLLNYPVSLDAAFLHQYLAPRDLESSDGTEFETQGNLSGGTATLTIRF